MEIMQEHFYIKIIFPPLLSITTARNAENNIGDDEYET